MTEKEDQERIKRMEEIDKKYGDHQVYDLKTHKVVYVKKDLLDEIRGVRKPDENNSESRDH